MVPSAPLSLEMQLLKEATPPPHTLRMQMNTLTTPQAALPQNEREDRFYSLKLWPSMSSSGGNWRHLHGQPAKLYE